MYAQVVDNYAAREDIDKEIERLFAAIQILRERRNALAPISKLPNEIFGTIFDATFSRQKDSRKIMSFTHVCRKWRQVALSNPILWTYLRMEDSDVDAGAQEIFLRSDLAPLSLHCGLHTLRGKGPAFAILRESAVRVFDLSIEFMGLDVPYVTKILAMPQPLLRVATLVNRGYPARFPALFAQSPHLKKLRLQGVILERSAHFRSLTHIEISFCPKFNPLPLLLETPVLEICAFMVGYHLSEAISESTITREQAKLPLLQKIKLSGLLQDCLYVMDRVDFPVSTYVHLGTTIGANSIAPDAEPICDVGTHIRQPSQSISMVFETRDFCRFLGSSFQFTLYEYEGSALTAALIGPALKMLARSTGFESMTMRFRDHRAGGYIPLQWTQILPDVDHLESVDVTMDPTGREFLRVLQQVDTQSNPQGATRLPKLSRIVTRVLGRQDDPYASDDEVQDNRFVDFVNFLYVRETLGKPITDILVVLEDDAEEINSQEMKALEEVAQCGFVRILNSKEHLSEKEIELNPSLAWSW